MATTNSLFVLEYDRSPNDFKIVGVLQLLTAISTVATTWTDPASSKVFNLKNVTSQEGVKNTATILGLVIDNLTDYSVIFKNPYFQERRSFAVWGAGPAGAGVHPATVSTNKAILGGRIA